MVNNLSNLSSIVPAPPPPAAPAAPPLPGAAQDANHVVAPHVQGAQQNQRGNNNNGKDNNANTSDGSHFSRLLSSQKQGNSNNGAGALSVTQPSQGHANSNSSSVSSGSGLASEAVSTDVVVTLLLTGQQNAGTTQDTTGNAPPSIQDVLARLQQILQQLLQIAQQASGPTASAASNAPAPTDTNNNNDKNPKSSSDNSGDPLAQLLAQIAALLQQLTQQTSTTQVAVAGTTDNATISPDAGNGSGNPAAALLAQLASELQKLKASDGKTPATDAANATISASGSSFDATLSALRQPSGAKDMLSSILTQVNDLLSTGPGGNAGSSSKHIAEDNTSAANAGQGALALALANPHSQPIQNDAFLKLVSGNAQSAPVADQVLVQIKNASLTEGSQIKIQLEPADLGKVTVQMNTDASGKTGVTITADNRQTLALLQNEARALEHALRDIGLKTDTGGLSFNLSGQQNQQQPQQQGSYTQVAAATTEDDADYYSAATTLYQYTAQQGLDIRV